MQTALQIREETDPASLFKLFQGSGPFLSIQGQLQLRLRNDDEERAYIAKVAGDFAYQWREMSVAAFAGNSETLLDTAADLEEGYQSLDTKIINGRPIMVAVGQVQDGAQSEIQRILAKLAFFQSLLKIAELLIPGLADVLGKAGVSQQAALQRIQEIAKPFEDLQRLIKAGIKTDAQRQTVTTIIEKLSEKLHQLGGIPGLKGIAERMMREVRALVQSPVLGLKAETQARLTSLLTPRVAEGLKAAQTAKVDPKAADPKNNTPANLKAPTQPSRTPAGLTRLGLARPSFASLNPATGASAMSRAATASAASRSSIASRAGQTVAAGVIAVAAATAPVVQTQAAISPTAPVSQVEAVVSPTASLATATVAPVAQEQVKDTTVQTAAVTSQAVPQQEAKEILTANVTPLAVEAKLPVNEVRVENVALKQDVADPTKGVQVNPTVDKPINPPPVDPVAQPVQPEAPKTPDVDAKAQPQQPDPSPSKPEERFKEAKHEATGTTPTEPTTGTKNDIGAAPTGPEAPPSHVENIVEKILKADPTLDRPGALDQAINQHNESRPERGTPEYKGWLAQRGEMLEAKLAEEAKQDAKSKIDGPKEKIKVAARPGCPSGCGGGICLNCG
jgi:hypothetical protein